MLSNILHQGALVFCQHLGQALPLNTNPRVRVGGQPIVTQISIYNITGCTLTPPNGGPCVTATWLTAATRLRSGGIPVLLDASQALCAPTLTGLDIKHTQTRVKGQ